MKGGAVGKLPVGVALLEEGVERGVGKQARELPPEENLRHRRAHHAVDVDLRVLVDDHHRREAREPPEVARVGHVEAREVGQHGRAVLPAEGPEQQVALLPDGDLRRRGEARAPSSP
jgi:hypothetical protein